MDSKFIRNFQFLVKLNKIQPNTQLHKRHKSRLVLMVKRFVRKICCLFKNRDNITPEHRISQMICTIKKSLTCNRKSATECVSLRYCKDAFTQVEILEKFLRRSKKLQLLKLSRESILYRYSSRNFWVDFIRTIFESTCQLQHSTV